ncbi:GNAT family N-acetyltransferase [Nocardia wallacei]|uniref:GNAT family N-acetyltransferase n=1 Tax=Nocardia wallacei TaxID=480035 RepID=UPI00245580B0|nr:GNAT family N-acetyltransferase [Nocardia wallacei]
MVGLRVVRGSVDDRGIGELLYEAIGGERSRLTAALVRYRDDRRTELLVATEAGKSVGVMGFRVRDDNITLLHIATAAGRRRDGIGRLLVNELRARGLAVVAETDAESVGFYRGTGFTVESLGEKYPGVERFRICLAADPG